MSFDILDFIEAKRDGGSHDADSLRSFAEGLAGGGIPDYQVAAWLMAAFIRGFAPSELSLLTLALANSGETLRFPDEWPTADKHSTGGVGDKTTLVAVPLAAALGVRVSKMAGRGLGFTGGTIDKLEAIPGFRTHLSVERFLKQIESIGCAITGHTAELAPAEKVLYSLRDVTGTVPSLPLIASSIVSKKLAVGAKGFVYDVKTGNGALMETRESARRLAETLVEISRANGKRAVALITGMDQPLGFAVGNAMEVVEAVRTLENNGPSDVTELCVTAAGEMAFASGVVPSSEEGIRKARRALESGDALVVFLRMVEAQSGDPRICENGASGVRIAPDINIVRAARSGVVSGFDTRAIGESVRRLGGGRMSLEDSIDLSVGVLLLKKCGDEVSAGEPLLEVHYSDTTRRDETLRYLEHCVRIDETGKPLPVVLERFPSDS